MSRERAAGPGGQGQQLGPVGHITRETGRGGEKRRT